MSSFPVDLLPGLAGSAQWPAARTILDTLKAKGFAAYIVGGALRDLISGHPPGDLDILTDASPDIVNRLFWGEKPRQVGQNFEVSLINGVEVASFRGDSEGGTLEADLG
ncbi:MAG TPA: hypothetical protein DHV36_10965, partial [Desulfobacteraceae bacterium]|nr:hypothetical protein [Desulfobacteraceae bacterium]